MRITEAMKSLKGKFTEREKTWIKVYFEADGNATEATRVVYGGTPGSCRVKGHKKKLKFQFILQEIKARGLDRMEYNGVTGIDFYLGNLEREEDEQRRFIEMVRGKKGLKKFVKLVYMT